MIKILFSIIMLLLYPLSSMGANITTNTSTILVIDESSSILTYNPPSIYLGEPEELVNFNFGGLVQVFQTDYYIDTRYDGRPTYSPSTYRNISINFPVLDLPSEVSAFNPAYNIGPFQMFGTEISGHEWNFCTVQTAIGNMCSNTVHYTGVPEDLTGTFDGSHLTADGYLSHDLFEGYYSFHIEASLVPLPGALVLFVSGIIVAFASFKDKNIK